VGTLYYGNARTPIEIEDRALAHLKFVILSKLRRNEGFGFSWSKSVAAGSGRSTVWVAPPIPLEFDFSEPARPPLNRAWLESLNQQASTSGGLVLVEEPVEEPPEPPQAP
jgi:hypothetical protein